MLVNVLPPLVLTCHCTVGVGVPLAVAEKLAVAPAVTVWLAGLAVTAGAVSAGGSTTAIDTSAMYDEQSPFMSAPANSIVWLPAVTVNESDV